MSNRLSDVRCARSLNFAQAAASGNLGSHRARAAEPTKVRYLQACKSFVGKPMEKFNETEIHELLRVWCTQKGPSRNGFLFEVLNFHYRPTPALE
ncbi:hypothetical protein AL073_01970 [Loktanella sp. 1ANDIMAR09]|nr:hypothetical protein AL073_01970 [Loktanella sp. 1ANDIMAR09]